MRHHKAGHRRDRFSLPTFIETLKNHPLVWEKRPIYYAATATGWTPPFWHGYSALPYGYQPPGQPPLVVLTLGLGEIMASFYNLRPGTNYQLRVSTDLTTWSNTGPALTATNTSEFYPQPFDLRSQNQLFFRLQSAP